MAYSWNSVTVGWDLRYLVLDDIKNFLLHFLEVHPCVTNRYISELILAKDDIDTSAILKNIFASLKLDYPEKYSSSWNKEWRKWRYCILICLIETVHDTEQLLMQVEQVYADLGYPVDMASFIYYMPATEDTEHLVPEQARIVLIKKLRQFIDEERIRIADCIDYLPDTLY